MADCWPSWWRSCRSRSVVCLHKLRKKLPNISKKLAKIYFASFFVTFSTAFAVTMMFPFLPFMVEFLLPWLLEDETQLPIYTGIVASAMFFGRVFSSYIWGAIADWKGRKPVIVVSLILMGLASAIFGFSVDYSMAVIFRFLVGFTNGALGNVKAVMSEVSDDSNQAFGLSLVGASWGLGVIIGPAISGVFSDPIGQYNLNITNEPVRQFLTLFPYSLPCLVNLLICLFAALLFFLLVPETLGVRMNRRRSEISQADIDLATKNADVSTSELEPTEAAEINDSESAALIPNDALEVSTEHAHTDTYITNHTVSFLERTDLEPSPTPTQSDQDRKSEANHEPTSTDELTDREKITDNSDAQRNGGVVMSEDSDLEEGGVVVRGVAGRRRLSWGQVPTRNAVKSSLRNHCIYLKDKTVFLSVLNYCTFSFALIGWNEVLPVWAKTSPHLGGLGFSLSQIGLALTIAGIVYFPFSFSLFPLLEKKFGSVKTVYGALAILIPATMLLPNVHYLSQWSGLLWFVLCLELSLCQILIGLMVTATMLFINNSVTFDKLGAINGLAMALTSIGRTFSPVVIGGLFSLSLSATMSGFGYPLDYRLVFLVFGFIYFLCVLLVACLPISINKQKIIEDC